MAADEVKFGADASAYMDVIRRMEERLDQLGRAHSRFGDRTKTAGDSMSIFGERRAALRLGEIAKEFTSGASASQIFADSIFKAEYALGRSFAPLLGIAAGYKLYEGLKKSADEAQKAREEIDKLSLPKDAFSGVEALSTHLSEIQPKLETIRNEVKGGAIPNIGEMMAAMFQKLDPKTLLSLGSGNFISKSLGLKDLISSSFTGAQEERQRQLGELFSTAKAEAGALVQQEQIGAGIQGEMLTGSKRAVELDQAHLETLLKQAAIYEQFKDKDLAPQRNQALDAETKRYRGVVDLINKKQDLEGKAVQHASDLADIERMAGSNQEKKLAGLLKEVEYRHKLLDMPLTPEERKKAELDLAKARQQLPANLRTLPLQSEANEINAETAAIAHSEKMNAARENFRRNTQEGKMDEWQKEFQQSTDQYYQNQKNQWDEYNMSMYGKTFDNFGPLQDHESKAPATLDQGKAGSSQQVEQIAQTVNRIYDFWTSKIAAA